jgi:hypothetical protein
MIGQLANLLTRCGHCSIGSGDLYAWIFQAVSKYANVKDNTTSMSVEGTCDGVPFKAKVSGEQLDG